MSRRIIFNLVLKTGPFNLIKSGFKKAEYRRICGYWDRHFSKLGFIKLKGQVYKATDIIFCFSLGYKKHREQIFVECAGTKIGVGLKSWGAPPQRVYILKLGKIVSNVSNK